MTLYLTDVTKLQEIAVAKGSGFVHAVKYCPAGATTNSENGVTGFQRVYPVLAEMEKQDLPLLLHGEVTDASVDVFDREGGVRRAPPGAAGARVSEATHGAGACHDPRGCGIRRAGRADSIAANSTAMTR